MKKRHIIMLSGIFILVLLSFTIFADIQREVTIDKDSNTKFLDGIKSSPKKTYMTYSSFEECAEDGNPILETYPEQCRYGTEVYIKETPISNDVDPDLSL